MVVRRLLALVLAVGLVVGALQLRQRLFGDAPADVPDDVRLVCVTELADVCAGLQGRAPVIEDATTTVARFEQRDPGLDVWLTVQPWPEFAVNARQRATQPELVSQSSDVLARSRVLMAVWVARAAALEGECAGALTWRCIGERADQPWAQIGGESGWGRVKVGLDAPSTSAAGLLELAQATSSYFGGQAFNSRLLDDPDFFAWLSTLAAAVEDTGQPPVERMLLTGSADYEFVGTLESFAAPLLARASGRADQIELRQVEPALTADVVAVGYGNATAAAEGIAEQVRAPLADRGWRVPGAETSSELEPANLPSNNGLPSVAALEALRRTWMEVAR